MEFLCFLETPRNPLLPAYPARAVRYFFYRSLGRL